eukprot:TRINITY_DN85252_c0_g1_i1.p1 TRINITY_DN85252_c0_g1~~TRINITY_DN85252_c0_g1_i1.p1  ORF type:complete len:311 (+),score=65.22 TRINITY_DN85252_c0_g1_i1:102-1034(+)
MEVKRHHRIRILLSKCMAHIIGPKGLVKTVPHAITFLVGLSGVICFSFALVKQKPFDATLGALIVLLGQYVFTLQNQRLVFEEELLQKVPALAKQVSTSEDFAKQADVDSSMRSVVVPNTSSETATTAVPESAAAQPVVSAAVVQDDLDLTSYAQALGVMTRGGDAAANGSALNQILLNSLAKEYLRCISAIQSYKAIFGGLGEDSVPSDGSAEDALNKSISVANVPIAPPVPLESTQTSITRKKPSLDLDLAEAEQATGHSTPPSPGGPPSPEQAQRRRSAGGSVASDSKVLPPPPTVSAGEVDVNVHF